MCLLERAGFLVSVHPESLRYHPVSAEDSNSQPGMNARAGNLATLQVRARRHGQEALLHMSDNGLWPQALSLTAPSLLLLSMSQL